MADGTSGEETSAQPQFHADFNDPAGNIIIKSQDGISFRTYDYFLKASR
jgi:hypothetical protein